MSIEWNGEGLPPVGCECEVKRALDWMPCKIVFISDFHVILQAKEEICWQTHSCQFRPIRNEVELRYESAIEALSQVVEYRSGCNHKAMARWLYEAISTGKVPHITLK